MSTYISNLNSYLDKVLPNQNPNLSTGKWVYNNKVVTYLNNPGQEERIIENALEYLNQDLKDFYDGIDLQEGKSIDPEIKKKFERLETEVQTQVKDYYNRHSDAYFFFRKLFFKDVDQIAKDLIDNIHHFETKLNPILSQYITNPSTNNANLLPIPEAAFSNIAQFLDINQLTAFTKTAKQGKDTIKNTRLLKAQEFGYKGTDPKEAEEYWRTLGKAVLKSKEERDFSIAYKEDSNTIDLEKTLKGLNKYNYVRLCKKASYRDIKILCQCLLHLIKKNEAKGIRLTWTAPWFGFNTWALKNTFIHASKTGEFDALEILLKIVPSQFMNRIKFGGKTFLENAVFTRNEPLVKLLIQYLPKHDRCLQLTVKNGDLKIARLLLEEGAKSNNWDRRGETALHWAIEQDQPLFIPLLKEFKSDFDQPIRKLWHSKPLDTPLQLAIRQKNLEMVKILLDNGANINKVSWDKSPLHFAFEMKDKKAAEYLLVQKANHENQGESGTALSWACNAGFLDVAQNLLHAGDDPNRPGPDGHFPLSLTKSTKALQFLKSNGANPNAEDAQGNTPLSQAIEANDWTQVDRLIALGADIHHKNAQGQTVMARFGNSHWFRLKLRGA